MNSAPVQPAGVMQRIGWRSDLPALPAGQLLARVSAQHRAGYEVHDGERVFNAQPAPRFLKRNLTPGESPLVGDFVAVEPGAPPHIVAVLPRRSTLARASFGGPAGQQTMATNVDVVFLLARLGGDFQPERIERSLALLGGSSVRAVVVLTRRDEVAGDAAAAAIATLSERLSPGTAIVAINGKDGPSVAALDEFLALGTTAALVGAPGAGKSTLTRTLLGDGGPSTTHDSGRGPHSAPAHGLLPLAGGACLIDSPGMRAAALTDDKAPARFADIEELIEQCRFAGCSHGTEPGCAVRAALDAGELAGERWRDYLELGDGREEQAARFENRLRDRVAPPRLPRRHAWEDRD